MPQLCYDIFDRFADVDVKDLAAGGVADSLGAMLLSVQIRVFVLVDED